MPLPPHIISTLKENLGFLQADKETQALIWNGKTDIYLDFVELICSVFDDTGFDRLVEHGEAVDVLGKKLTDLLLQIGEITNHIDAYMDPTELANLPEMEEVRRLAHEALETPLLCNLSLMLPWDQDQNTQRLGHNSDYLIVVSSTATHSTTFSSVTRCNAATP